MKNRKYTKVSEYLYKIDIAYASRGIQGGGRRDVWGAELARDRRNGLILLFALEESGRIEDLRDVGGEKEVVCCDRVTLVELDATLIPTGRRFDRDMTQQGRMIESDGSLTGWDAEDIVSAVQRAIGVRDRVASSWVTV